MKKTFLTLAAITLFSGVAFAQETTDPFPTEVTFTSPAGHVEEDPETGDLYLPLSQMNTTVSLTLDKVPDVVGAIPMVAIIPGAAGFTEDLFKYVVEPADSNPIVVTLDASKWGEPYMGNYYTTIMLTYVNAEEDYVLRDEEPIFFQMPCVTPNNNPAEFVYAYPNGNWDEGDKFADAYRMGEITFAFSNEISFENETNIGTITYDFGDLIVAPITKYTSDWNRLDGYWAVTFDFRDADLEAEDLAQIEIKLSGVKSVEGNSIVEVPTIKLENTSVLKNAPRKNMSRIENDLTNGNDPVNVFNIQGMLVKESINKSAINELPAGFYIVDGKKVVVR